MIFLEKVRIPIINLYILFYPSIFFISLVPISSGSLFDFTFLPLIFIFTIFLLTKKIIINRSIKKICLIYIFFILFITIIRMNLHGSISHNIEIYIALALRSILPISFIFLGDFLFLKFKKIDYLKQLKFFKILLFIWMTSIVLIIAFSIYDFTQSNMNLGLSFPFYSFGLDRHVFGPAMAFVSISSCVIYLNNDFIKNRIYNTSILIFLSLSTIASIGSSSRGPLIIYLVFYGMIIMQKNNFKLKVKKKIIFLISILFGFLLIVYAYIIFTNPFIIDLILPRFFSTLQAILNPFQDTSRGDQVSDLVTTFLNTDFWLIGNISNPIITPDSGPYLIIANFGLLTLIIFISIFYFLYNGQENIFIKSFLVAQLFQFFLSSETIFIPRYIVLVTWSFSLIYISIYLNKKRIIYKLN